MNIITVKKSGKTIMIVYMEGRDQKTVQSKEPAAPEFGDAWKNLETDVKTEIAHQIGVNDHTQLEGFNNSRTLAIDKVHFDYGEGGGDPIGCSVHGHYSIAGTNFSTDVKFEYDFKQKHTPKDTARELMEEAVKYAENRRAQGSLFDGPNGGREHEEKKSVA